MPTSHELGRSGEGRRQAPATTSPRRSLHEAGRRLGRLGRRQDHDRGQPANLTDLSEIKKMMTAGSMKFTTDTSPATGDDGEPSARALVR